MRFGNAPYTSGSFSYNTDLNLYYYDLTESVYRPNLTNPGDYSPAGGRFFIGNPSAPAGSTGPILSDSLSTVVKTINRTTEYTSWTNDKVVPISITEDNFNSGVVFDQERPPSHKTLLVEFLNSGGTVIASLNFNTVYSRDTDGNNPVIVTGNNYLNNTPANHKLYYSYPTGTATKGYWILQFMLGSGVVSDIINIRISFKVGYYNMVNSVVPKTGYNFGSGTAAARFPLSSGVDYYSTITPVYNNSQGSSFIDDYSATFSITMAQNEGNGSSGSPVYYTEAFLFNSVNDLFSIIRFPYPSETTPVGFEKNNQLSYLISWTIKSIT